MDKREEIENLVKEKLNIKEIDPNATLNTYGLDSLDLVEFIFEIEDKYGITFEEDETMNIKTVGGLVELILKKIA